MQVTSITNEVALIDGTHYPLKEIRLAAIKNKFYKGVDAVELLRAVVRFKLSETE